MDHLLLKGYVSDAVKKDRQSQLARATNGQKELRARMQAKRGRVKEVAIGTTTTKLLRVTLRNNLCCGMCVHTGNQRHEVAMRELQKRRAEVGGAKAKSNPAAQQARGGNRHLNEFAALKQGYQRRKGSLKNLLSSWF
jgi:hypothetical protein